MVDLVEQIKTHEGCIKKNNRHVMYQDTEGVNTIGYGINVDQGLSEEEAEVLLTMRLDQAHDELLDAFPWFENLSRNRQDALINMVFNLGLTRLLYFDKMLTAIREGKWQKAHDEALDSRWARQVGQRAQELADQLLNG